MCRRALWFPRVRRVLAAGVAGAARRPNLTRPSPKFRRFFPARRERGVRFAAFRAVPPPVASEPTTTLVSRELPARRGTAVTSFDADMTDRELAEWLREYPAATDAQWAHRANGLVRLQGESRDDFILRALGD